MKWDKKRISDLFVLKQGTYLKVEEMVAERTDEFLFAVYGANGVVGYSKKMMYAERTPLISCRGANCGVVHFTEPNAWVGNNSIACISKGEVDQRFFYYQFFRALFTDVITGAAQPQITLTNLSPKLISVPPLEAQRRIADTLSAYDDLIENNRRRIQLLEESARLLYKEWFVHLRFPGHEHVKLTDGVPQGWKKKTLRGVSERVDYGYTASAQAENIGPKVLRITDIVPDVIDWSSVPYCPASERDLAKFQLREGDVVIARTGATVGYAKRIGSISEPAVFASYLVRFRFTNELDDMLGGIFVESSGYKAYVRNNCGGAAQPNANAQVLAGAEILIPPAVLQREFREIVEPSFRQRDILQRQNLALTRARDLLLPRLMSGELVA